MKFQYFLVVALVAIILFGCSGSTNPIGSDLTSRQKNPNNAPSDPVTWGFWQVTMDPESLTLEATPLRTANFTANVNNLLESKPGNLILTDMDITDFFSEGKLDVTVGLKHPFVGLDQYHGFDVMGVFMHNANSYLEYDGLTYGSSVDSGNNVAILRNPDGYTRWFNFTEFKGSSVPILEYWPGKLGNLPGPNATLNPYKIFADGLNTYDDYHTWVYDDSNSDDRGIFRAGGLNSRRYELQFPIIGGSPKVDFMYAVIASWEPGDPALTGQPAVYDPFDFPISANLDEAFFVNIDTSESGLYYVDSSNKGGTFKADIEIFDWQGGIVANNGVTNEINSLIIEGDFIPGGSHQINQSGLFPIASNGSSNSSVYEIEIPGCAPQNSGQAAVWVIVESGSSNGGSYGQGYPTQYPPDAVRAAFNLGFVDISNNNPNIPVTYNLVIDVQRNSTNLITAIKLDWDDNDGVTQYNIYRQDPFDPSDNWVKIPASPITGSQYSDTDIVGNEAYQYYVVALSGAVEVVDKSVEGYAILENAEDNVNTDSVWATAAFHYWSVLYGNPTYLFNEFAPLAMTPQNGTYCWDEGGYQNNGGGPGTYWSLSATAFSTPVLPIPDGASTCIADFCIRLNNVWPGWTGEQWGCVVGVTNSMNDGQANPLVPSQDHLAGLDYNIPHIHGLSSYGTYSNITSANDAGHGSQYPGYQDIAYAWSRFALPDVFTIPNARAAFGWGCGNTVGGTNIENAGTSYDDIAILVY